MKKRPLILALAFLSIVCITVVLYDFNVIPHKKYPGSDFGIPTYQSPSDLDGDGVDDQTDLLQSVRQYIAQRPRYKSRYYAAGGYPDDGYGVCTDVVAFGMRGAGYDLMALVAEDIAAAPDCYTVETPDRQIDFRRVRNLKVYFRRHAQSLTTDVRDIAQWQGGDIVIWDGHIGVVSDSRNRKGIPFVIHHANPFQLQYEEDILETWGPVVGHYRLLPPDN